MKLQFEETKELISFLIVIAALVGLWFITP